MKSWVAILGQNIQFVAFWAHFFAAGWLILLYPHLALVFVITAAAAVKEFWYDAKYEKNPPQTFLDNSEDFFGWALGAWISYDISLLFLGGR
jgi:hypothetical protein